MASSELPGPKHWQGALVVLRHGERLDYVPGGDDAAASGARRAQLERTERPWDTSLSVRGRRQAQLAGAALARELHARGLAPPGMLVASPLARCVETAAALRQGLGAAGAGLPLKLDARLAETQSEDWYLSWAVRGVSDARWGGPRVEGGGASPWRGAALLADPPHGLHPAALRPSHELLRRPEDYAEDACLDICRTHRCEWRPAFTALAPETLASVHERAGGLARALRAQHPAQTVVLVTHGGVASAIHLAATTRRAPLFGFTAMSIVTGWGAEAEAHLAASTAHLADGEELGLCTTAPA
jgi:broad specificity phosphatase PhoE